MKIDLTKINWRKMQGLLPVIVQDETTRCILMLGYMNEQALNQTLKTQWMIFYSRSKQRLWMKGETSGNRLKLCQISFDCDQDALLAQVNPTNVVCHLGNFSCFEEQDRSPSIISRLEATIKARQQYHTQDSYVAKLLESGIGRMAQKVGEEGVEVALAAALENEDTLCEEVADLLFHVLVLLRAKDIGFNRVLNVLEKRNQ